LQKTYPPVENYDDISSADELPRKKRKKDHSESNSDHKSRRKLKAKKKSRSRKRKLSTSDSSSSDSSDSDDCIGGRAAAKKIHTGSDSVVTNPDWVFLQTDELTAARERLSTDIHAQDDRSTDSLMLIKATLKDLARTRNFAEDLARILIRLRAPKKIRSALKSALNLAYRSVAESERIHYYLHMGFTNPFKLCYRFALSGRRKFIDSSQETLLNSLRKDESEYRNNSRRGRGGSSRGSTRGGRGANNNQPRVCHSCHKEGHYANNCPNKK